MCKERRRTRDLLLEYDTAIMPARPRAAGLAMVYPWENTSLNILSKQIYEIAAKNGYLESEEEFWKHFSEGAGVVVGTIDTFDVPGKENQLYLDKETEILYYFKVAGPEIATEIAEQVGVVVVGTEDSKTYLYIPIHALPIESLILDRDSSTITID